MSEVTPPPEPNPGLPRWFGPSVVLMLLLQLGVLWVQGGLLNRQRSEIRSLREEIQTLAEAIEQNWGGGEPLEDYQPHRTVPSKPSAAQPRFKLVRVGIQNPDEAEEKAIAEHKNATRQTAEQTQAKVEDTQKKLSITENARIADEKAKREAEEHKWTRLAGAGVAAAFLIFLIRAWIRRK